MDQEIRPITIPGHWDFTYNYFAGDAASRFFHELKNKRIMGTLCPKCERVLVPARGFCDACYVETTEWREVGSTGTVEAFTILTSNFPGLPDPPVAVGYVLLEGASSAVLNFITGLDLTDLDAAGGYLLTGPTAHVAFVDSCEGRITDFSFTVDAP
jgi:hypothetical protein